MKLFVRIARVVAEILPFVLEAVKSVERSGAQGSSTKREMATEIVMSNLMEEAAEAGDEYMSFGILGSIRWTDLFENITDLRDAVGKVIDAVVALVNLLKGFYNGEED